MKCSYNGVANGCEEALKSEVEWDAFSTAGLFLRMCLARA